MNIDDFIQSKQSGECRLLKGLYEFLRVPYNEGGNWISGLGLLDIEPYGGTILYDPRMTPTNTLAFATTGGDDVHFGMLLTDGGFGDASPIVMTVPMADKDPMNCNFIVGETLHDFLCLGCVHGFFSLEKLAYTWCTELFSEYGRPEEPSDNQINYERFRAAFSLSHWPEIEQRQKELDSRYKPKLEFRKAKTRWKLW